VFDHAVLDVAAFRRVLYRGFPDALVHQPSNLPMSGETESPPAASATVCGSPGNVELKDAPAGSL